MEFHQIRYFLAVMREGNFSKAALACNVSQPSITRAIRKLEQELGGVLFDRRPSGATLTTLGRSVLPRLEAIYKELEQALREAESINERRTQLIRIGLTCTIGPKHFIQLIDTVQARVPTLNLRIEEDRARNIIERLVSDEIDAAIACQPVFPEEVASRKLYAERYCVAFREGHRFEQLTEVPLQELIGERYLERLHCEFDDYYAAHFGDEPFDLDVRFSSEREDWVQAMVVAGLGVAIMPEFLPVTEGVLRRPLCDPTMVREVHLLTMRGRPYAQAVDAFMRIASSIKWNHAGTSET